MQQKFSGTSNSAVLKKFNIKSAASDSAWLNSATPDVATLKTAVFNSGASSIKKKLFWQLNIVAVVVMCCFTTAQQSAQFVAQ